MHVTTLSSGVPCLLGIQFSRFMIKALLHKRPVVERDFLVFSMVLG